MAKDFDQSIRSDLSTKQSQIKIVTGREPSIPELTENKPAMRYVPGKGLMMYVRYNNKRYHVKFSDDPKQEGRIRVEDLGQPESIRMQFIDPDQGGTGQDLSGSTGAISISSGTVAAGTLPIAVGGTNATANTIWINSNVTMNTDGTLEHDGSGSGAVTMNTLTDANDIRGRITAGLASNGDVNRTVAINKGGTNATDSNGWLNSRVTTNANGTLNYDATSATAPNITNIAGTLTIAKGGTGATDSNGWLNNRIQMNENGTLDFDGDGSGTPTLSTLTDGNNIRSRVVAGLDSSGNVDRTVAKDKGGFGADASTVSVALITDNIEAGGIKTGRNLGDGLESVIIWSDAAVAGGSAGDAAVASSIWQETSTSAIVKITFNYLHDDENKTIKVIANALCSSGQTATMTVGLHDMSAGVLSAQVSGAAKVSDTGTTTSATFTRVVATLDVTSSFTEGVLYKGQISLHTSDAARPAKMTGAVVLAYGS